MIRIMNKNIIIIGAGEAGIMLAREIKESTQSNNKYNIIGFIDDNTDIKNILGVEILGKIENIPNIVKECISNDIAIDEFIIAIPSADEKILSKILNIISTTNIKYKIVPGLFEIIKGKFSLKDVREIEISDLLGREEIGFDEELLKEFYKDKVVLVTGGAGSIGSEIVKQVITLPIKLVIAVDHNENSLHSLILSINGNDKFTYIVSNISDNIKMDRILKEYKPDVIFHAAAHKHLPLMEKYPEESIKNNILVTNKLVKLTIENNIKDFIFISTDKAVNPTSLMGCSKRICEMIIHSHSKENHNTRFKITRFGNVLGSNGSVIPIFEKQIKLGGPITITHPDMLRFFMSIREAARLVIKASTLNEALIFTLDMGKQIKILDLAKNMIKMYEFNDNDVKIVFTGIREGEKLYEEIIMDCEKFLPSKYKKLFIVDKDERALDKKERENMISLFEKASIEGSKENIKTLIKEYIKEYV